MEAGPEDWVRWWHARGRRELSCILMTAWDPIGVSDAPEAWGEYDDYVPSVAFRLRDAAHVDDAIGRVAEYLDHVERDWIEILTEESSEANRRFAATLVAWYEWSYGRRLPDGPPELS